MNWQQNLITENEHIRELLAGTRTIAVLGDLCATLRVLCG